MSAEAGEVANAVDPSSTRGYPGASNAARGVFPVTTVLPSRTINCVPDTELIAADDAVLLAATGRGNRVALAELYERHAPWLLLRLARRCADAGIVEEAVQDTFVAVWRNASKWNAQGEVAAWIWGIAARRLIDAIRRSPPATASLDAVCATAESSGLSAEDEVLLGGEYGDIGAALERLPPELFAVVRATVVDGLTCKEAARLLGIPTGTVKTRMMRARMILRRDLA
jgi:RNA polymerase sigma-70 factor (ECF subfamily)